MYIHHPHRLWVMTILEQFKDLIKDNFEEFIIFIQDTNILRSYEQNGCINQILVSLAVFSLSIDGLI